MTLKVILHYLWKLPVCGLAFFIGLMAGNMLATGMGLSAPELPAGTDPGTLMQYTVLGSLALSVALAGLAPGLSGGFVARWLVLSFVMWVSYALNNYIEAALFTTMSAASPFTVVMYLPACLLCAAAAAGLFPPGAEAGSFVASARAYFSSRTSGAWAWRSLAALAAFPVAYLGFGSLIAPLVLDYYRQGTADLVAPGWDQLLPVLALRTVLFLLACLPVLMSWRGSNWSLFAALSVALFMFVGGANLLQAYWLPPVLRVVHSLEILADEIVYAGALVILLTRAGPRVVQQPAPQPA
jgi:hypothetical protein